MMKKYVSTIAAAAASVALIGATAASAHSATLYARTGTTGAQVRICAQVKKDALRGHGELTRAERLAIRTSFRACVRQAVQVNYGHSRSSRSSMSGSSVSSRSSKAMLKKVEIEDHAFSPSPLTVKVGTTVRWKNEDDTDHTVTSSGSSVLDSGTLDENETYSHTFTGTGTYNYFCEFHPEMKGKVIVTE